jgi:uncharacterized membrane protein YgcG
MADFVDMATSYSNAAISSMLVLNSNATRRFPPTLVVFWTACTSPEPIGNRTEFIAGWSFAFVACAVALFISLRHLLQLHATSISTRRDMFMRITALTPIYAICCLLGATIPRGSLLWLELMHMYEALVVQQFAELMLHFVYTDLLDPTAALSAELSFERRTGNPHDGTFYRSGSSQGGYLDEVARALTDRSRPRRLLASAPLCCCFQLVGRLFPAFAERSELLPCARSILPSLAVLNFVRAAIRAFVVGLPTLAMIRLWAREAWDRPPDALDAIEQACSTFELLLTASALYALVILFKACRGHLPRHRLSWKFAAIKAVIVLNNVQKLTIRLVLELIAKSAPHAAAQFCIDWRSHAAWIQYVLLLIELPAVAILHTHTYRPQELIGGPAMGGPAMGGPTRHAKRQPPRAEERLESAQEAGTELQRPAGSKKPGGTGVGGGGRSGAGGGGSGGGGGGGGGRAGSSTEDPVRQLLPPGGASSSSGEGGPAALQQVERV